MARRASRLFFLAPWALAAAGALAAGPAPGFELRPGAVVDASRTTIWVMEPGGGVSALDVASGAIRWQGEGADRPLYADDQVMVAQRAAPGGAGILHIVVLDARDPDRTVSTAFLEMPVGALAPVIADRNTSFDLRAVRDGDAVLVAWVFTRLPKQAVEQAEGVAPAVASFSGGLRVPLSRGPVRELSIGEVPDPKRRPIEADGAAELAVNALGGGARQVGDALVLVEMPQRDPRQAARVHRFSLDGSKALAEFEVFGDGNLVKQISADGRHLLGSREVAAAQPGSAYRWELVDLETGLPVAVFANRDPAGAFFLADRTVVLEAQPHAGFRSGSWQTEPQRLIALDTTTGQTLWTHDIADPTYRGPLPPGP